MSSVIDDPNHPTRNAVGRRALIALLTVPPLAVVTAAIAGLGMLRGVPSGLALLCGLAIATLPALGLRGLLAGRPAAWPTAAWVWALVLLVGLPLYFPGERGDATEAGLRMLAAPAGRRVAASVGAAGSRIVSSLGKDPKPLTARIDEAEPAELRPRAALVGSDPGRATPDRAISDPAAPVRIPYEGSERSLRISVDIDGPEVGERFPIIFDTGATFTTLDRATVDGLGLAITSDSPRVKLRTANGEIEAPLVLADAIWLGDKPVEWVTIAVCDSCANPPAVGLLGLNVTQRFGVSLNHDRKRIELRARRGADDRKLDVGQWLQIRSRAIRRWDGSVEVEVTGHNRARQGIEQAVVDLDCGGDGFAIQLDDIEPGASAVTTISLPRGTDCSQQAISLSRAHWRLDRF
jgi:hypothetical protein